MQREWYIYDNMDNINNPTDSSWAQDANCERYHLSNNDKFRWLSRWPGWNGIYYNSAYYYRPWPGTSTYSFPWIEVADLRRVPARPTKPTENLIDLTDQHWWTGVPVYNKEVKIYDNQDYRFAASPTWTLQTTDAGESWLDDFYYTAETGDRVGWSFRIGQSGSYDVYTYVPAAIPPIMIPSHAGRVTDTSGESDCIRVDQQAKLDLAALGSLLWPLISTGLVTGGTGIDKSPGTITVGDGHSGLVPHWPGIILRV